MWKAYVGFCSWHAHLIESSLIWSVFFPFVMINRDPSSFVFGLGEDWCCWSGERQAVWAASWEDSGSMGNAQIGPTTGSALKWPLGIVRTNERLFMPWPDFSQRRSCPPQMVQLLCISLLMFWRWRMCSALVRYCWCWIFRFCEFVATTSSGARICLCSFLNLPGVCSWLEFLIQTSTREAIAHFSADKFCRESMPVLH